MRIAIDASNLRQGGGLTHLAGILGAVAPEQHGVERIVVFGQEGILRAVLPSRPGLFLVDDQRLKGGLFRQLVWQRRHLPNLARDQSDLLFVPGGSFVGEHYPFVTMCRNMLPFERAEVRRYGWHWNRFRLELLRLSQARTFRKAAGVIFLTAYAQRTVAGSIGPLLSPVRVIPHGVEERFRLPPRPRPENQDGPFRLLYVSIVSPYKHPWNVARAVGILRRRRWPVELDLVGPAESAFLPRLQRTLAELDPAGKYLRYLGQEEFKCLHKRYHEADVFIFASSCENMPNILLEAMTAGLPIACSRCGPMPEVLGDAGVYFDPDNATEIADAVERLLREPELCQTLAWRAYERAKEYSWTRCAEETFSFLTEVAHNHKERSAHVRDSREL